VKKMLLLTPGSDYEAAVNALVSESFLMRKFKADDGVLMLQSEEGWSRVDGNIPNIIGFFALTEEGQASVKDAEAIWTHQFGESSPGACLLSGTEDAGKQRDLLSAWLLDKLSAERVRLMGRNVRLMQGMAQLRLTHSETQASFERLESFYYQKGEDKRFVARHLEPVDGISLLLKADQYLTQRLPVESVGISDVAIYLRQTPVETGAELNVSLRTVEDDVVVASWNVSSACLTKGWQRFSVMRALGTDPLTTEIDLEWSGAKPLTLALAGKNPDPRWSANIDGRSEGQVLAIQVWSAVPGVLSPASSAAHTQGEPRRRKWIVGLDLLQRVESLEEVGGSIHFDERYGGVRLSPTENQTLAARLESAAPAGASRFVASVETKNADAPRVEYAIGVAPKTSKQTAGKRMPEFMPDCVSDWVSLPAETWSNLELLLPEPLSQRGDIYLMARLSSGKLPDVDVAACFFPFMVHE